jgi:hypothetical protein
MLTNMATFKPEHDPVAEELDRLLTGEERDALAQRNVPEDVRAEILEDLQRRHDAELEHELPEDYSPEE